MTWPTAKNALAAKASVFVSPASSRNSVLMPQMNDAASVVRRMSTRYVRWTIRASGVMRWGIYPRRPRHAGAEIGVRYENDDILLRDGALGPPPGASSCPVRLSPIALRPRRRIGVLVGRLQELDDERRQLRGSVLLDQVTRAIDALEACVGDGCGELLTHRPGEPGIVRSPADEDGNRDRPIAILDLIGVPLFRLGDLAVIGRLTVLPEPWFEELVEDAIRQTRAARLGGVRADECRVERRGQLVERARGGEQAGRMAHPTAGGRPDRRARVVDTGRGAATWRAARPPHRRRGRPRPAGPVPSAPAARRTLDSARRARRPVRPTFPTCRSQACPRRTPRTFPRERRRWCARRTTRTASHAGARPATRPAVRGGPSAPRRPSSHTSVSGSNRASRPSPTPRSRDAAAPPGGC